VLTTSRAAEKALACQRDGRDRIGLLLAYLQSSFARLNHPAR
jgi:hypothetical protein